MQRLHRADFPHGMPEIVSHIRKTLDGHRRERIIDARDRLVYNFGDAGRIAADQLEELYLRYKSAASSKHDRSWFRWAQGATTAAPDSPPQRSN